MAMTTRTTFCRICEATCGLEVDVEDGRVSAIRPDSRHVVSRGYACLKGTRFRSVQYSPDRVLHPLKRVDGRFERVGWEQALSEIGAKIRELVARHGPHTVAHVMGSPAGTSVVNPIFRTGFYAGLGSDEMYGVGSVDCNNKFRVSEDMYGSAFRLAFPDVDHCDFLMILGGNPAVSGMSLVHVPRSAARFRANIARGGRVVFVNPRRTESAEASGGEQVFIRPDTDVFFLAAFANELIRVGGVDRERIDRHMKGFETLRSVVEAWTPERSEAVTGVPAAVLRELAGAHGRAASAALYMSTGVNQGSHGSLCFWLLESINAISGNLDRRGGTLMGRGIFDWAAEAKKKGQFERKPTPDADGFSSIVDTHPVGLLADRILRPRERRLTALVVEASNPLLNFPNPNGRLDQAFRELELVVSIDLFRNETGNRAHYVLPVPSFLERADIPYALQTFAGNCTERYVHYADPVVEPPPDVREEWWIFTRLARASGVPLFGSRLANAAMQWNATLWESKRLRGLALTPARMISLMLWRAGLGTRRRHLREHPHGLLLEPNRPGDFLGTDRVLTEDGKVQLAPPDLVAAAAGLEEAYLGELERRDGLKLISKRELRSLNSWLRNFEGYAREKTNTLVVHPRDAERLGLATGDMAEVSSRSGKLRVPVRVSDELMPGTVALPHGWGHADSDGLSIARRHPGVNSNLLAGDGAENMEKLSGMSHLSGIPVEVSKAEADRV